MEDVKKSESTDRVVVPTTNEQGQPRIVTSSRYIQETRKQDLMMPQRLCTFDRMAQDDAVYNSIDITNLHVINSLYNGKFVPKKGSQRSKVAADYLNYCIRNMGVGNWLDACTNAATDLQYGFSLLNIVTEVKKYGQYKGARTLKKLAPRDQKSIYGWIWDKNNRDVIGCVQKPMMVNGRKFTSAGYNDGISELSIPKYIEHNYPIMRSEQLLHFRYNCTNNNPQGNPPLLHIYDAWLEKKLVEKYEVVGVSKDLGGALVLRVPSELVERAMDPQTYPNEAKEYKDLQNDAARLHAGEASYIVLTSDVDDTTKTPLYDLKFQGIEGGGKQYKTSDIIDQKKKSIYNVFGTGFLLLGQDSVGSYSLSSSATSTHGYYVERNTLQKKVIIDTVLSPKLLAANNIFLDWKDMPEFEPADPTEMDMDVLSKVIQRTKSVDGMTPDALTYLYEKAGWPTEGIEKLNFDSKGESRAGESQGSSGTGKTQSGGKSSATNNENGGTEKSLEQQHFVIDYETDDEVVAVNTQTGEPLFIPREK